MGCRFISLCGSLRIQRKIKFEIKSFFNLILVYFENFDSMFEFGFMTSISMFH